MVGAALSGKKYKAYPEYKNSGVEWLGKIPEHWYTVPLKHLAELNPKKSGLDKRKMSQQCNFVPMEKLKLNDLKLDETKLVSEVYDGYTYFENGDVLIAKVTPCFENKNMAVARGLSNGVGFGSSEIYVLRAKPKLHNQFLFYRLQEDGFMDIATAAMSGAGGLKRVPAEIINTYTAAFPAYEEQQKIANFLDHETAKVDALTTKQENLIELLKEKRQAVIYHAVTRGLNADVPMKCSGVEWLGNIPKHWGISKLRFISSFGRGLSITKANLKERGIPCVSYGEVHSKFGFEVDPAKHNLKFVDESYLVSSPDSLLSKGDFVFADTSEDIDGSGNFTQLTSNEMVFAGYHTVVVRPFGDNYYRFLAYMFDSPAYRTQVRNGVKGVKVFSVTQAILKNTNVWLPPFDEQKEIANELDQKTKNIDKLIAKQQEAILLMKERKTALISAAVTGKIDVRNYDVESLGCVNG